MPELPEVETVRRGLTQLVAGATIDHVDVYYPKMVRPDAEIFTADLIGRKIEKIDRRGKYLLFRFSGDLTLISHLRMEGKYDVQPEGSPIPKHTHVIFHLKDQRELRYNDTRKFGRMRLVKTGTEATELKSLAQMGPEPTESALTLAYMQRVFGKSHKIVKPFLLDQSKIAGLGNIYVDEVLWLSKINPLTPADTLTQAQLSVLRQNIIAEIARAIQGHGTTVHTFSTAFGETGDFQNELHVYGHEGEPCERCGTEIVKIKVAQRGTHFCPHCQPYPPEMQEGLVDD
ncbi:bifunctional DNA-formamidopyrimidine glycosylase/DNA-(apurinic or apyrimidinic site) lyase [Levilactobacillus tujiorum]|uniref:Formamidopyrimidine-DNA glycosylase n=1 Tax=Levilactobacillus tujiorum TaxID=2912243 RepID=A0ABX1L5C0_9LACO|nr:bifunctional DNA-formamidopyrimidine glycosylase/DNA-(apurinic or apyrimidinic site) lyase [Levilactobacillus tujiorum]MCH5464531.1 bifunctional DNA-formamidopyrimidine glycosylase/DNA-(apurinic or apyrimidinic site) lyase [Levilactobacillus tujiorum]NLR11771.1 bifunctional DNA-formamidopyrimidine glycosylase/DNA-(apurinic or apyrimidinic site) lyase [Lactobacillus sp. HBUAS51387]NLR29511.1 bifunctional DNA-formamidopyrimidine glycosylase/DNA-(apurinic or apyrimidinic site) lyase [Levilactoba